MRVLVTGASGFIGTHLVAALLARGSLRGRGDRPQSVDDLLLADHAPPVRVPAHATMRIRCESGDLCDPAFVERLFGERIDSVFALAASLTSEAETDFAKGLAVNVQAPLRLLEACRAQGEAPRFVFASSIAAFGAPLPDVVDDAVAQTPQTSYGTHKVIVERLIDDYSRHGFVDGRTLRLPVVMIRPQAATPSVSDRVAAIVREPLLGRDVVCGLASHTQIPVASVQRVADALLDVHDLPATAFGHTRAMNLPSLSVTPARMAEALRRYGARRRLGCIIWQPDARLQAVVDGWPGGFVSERASRHGVRSDLRFEEIIDAFLEEQ